MSYSKKEIIDIAIGIEETGYEFYRGCAEKFRDSQIKDVFTFLAREELQHKQTFTTLLQDTEQPSGIFNEEYFLYLKSIGKGKIFPAGREMERRIEAIGNPEEAIRMAFDDERESILFYNEMKNMYDKNSGTQKILEDIIAEERKHVLLLMDLIEKSKITS